MIEMLVKRLMRRFLMRRFLHVMNSILFKIKPISSSDLKKPIRLYLGSGGVRRKGFVGVDINPFYNCLVHDCTKPFPLPDGSVERILTEDMLEHSTQNEIVDLLNECYRILEDGGKLRIGVPDYNNPKDKPYLLKGHDERFLGHKTLTTYDLMKSIIERSHFKKYIFYHYWKGDYFHMRPIDYSLGWVCRTPDNDDRNRKGNALLVTSLVIDLIKSPSEK